MCRHRHAAAVVGSNIYVFGGLGDDVIYSSMIVLDTKFMRWKEIKESINRPGACHSHAMVARDSQLFLFGGHNGHKPLGDLYSFDTELLSWKREIISGRPPFARFSHSMFVYNNYIGILGGCPFRQQEHQMLSLLDLNRNKWVYVKIESVGKKNMWVRSSAVVIDEELVLVGGGASCYAFGTYFNPPMKLDLSFLKVLDADSDFVFQVEKKCAKEIKDILKKSGWLDPNRKVKVTQNGCHVLFPVNGVFVEMFYCEKINSEKGILLTCGGSLEKDELAVNKKGPKSPQNLMRELVKPLLERSGKHLALLEQLPTRLVV
jgi:tRNA wybutosine-synthesizing protein 3